MKLTVSKSVMPQFRLASPGWGRKRHRKRVLTPAALPARARHRCFSGYGLCVLLVAVGVSSENTRPINQRRHLFFKPATISLASSSPTPEIFSVRSLSQPSFHCVKPGSACGVERTELANQDLVGLLGPSDRKIWGVPAFSIQTSLSRKNRAGFCHTTPHLPLPRPPCPARPTAPRCLLRR